MVRGGGESVGDSSIVVSVGGFVSCSHGLYLGLCFWVDRFWITFTCIAMHVQEIYIYISPTIIKRYIVGYSKSAYYNLNWT